MRVVFFLAILGLAFSCSSEKQDSTDETNTDVVQDSVNRIDTIQQIVTIDTNHKAETQSLGFYFEKYGVEGAFLMFDPQTNRHYTYHGERSKQEFLPASTFKILNSLIALETGVIADTNVVLKWDGKDRGNPNWNQDQDMKQAFRNSTVWFYQELARGIGAKRMQHYVNKSAYGNESIGEKVDDFWLNGELRITMREQVKFLRKLYRNELPFSNKNANKVIDMMKYLQTDKYTVYGKTGWALNQNIGWFVGFVIHDYEEDILSSEDVPDSLKVVKKKRIRKGYYFATNIDIKNKQDAAAREAITIDILKSLSVI